MPTQQEEEAVSQVQSVLGQLTASDKFRVLARVNANANEAAVQNEREEFFERRERVRGRRRQAKAAGVDPLAVD
jgi:hypothetical protein